MCLNEADTRAKLITPALHSRGWTEDLIRREERAAPIDIVGDKAWRRNKKRTDYTLRLKLREDSQPVAVALIEAKKEGELPAHGLEQAKGYGRLLNVPFVFSSNGRRFVEYDSFTGMTSEPLQLLTSFPMPEDLRRRYEAGRGFDLEDNIAKPLLTPYEGGDGFRRYYQDAAIRAALEKIARCRKKNEPARVLLSLATGTGKTFIAVNLLKRIADAGRLQRALFLCDRDELRAQAQAAFHNAFSSDAAIVRLAQGENEARNARVHIATYQTLGVDTEDGDESFLTQHYPEDYFSHIIIDECHRSAWNKWSQVLRRNSNAVQIGLTATPRSITGTGPDAEQDEEITAHNLRYFGEPAYEYSITQGMDDGYLAACQIRKSSVNLDETGITAEEIMARNPRDPETGEPLSPAEVRASYDRYDYERFLMLPDRVRGMCKDLFDALLKSGGPEQKTIIFCARDSHADAVATEMNNLYAVWRQQQGDQRGPGADPYAFKCTAAVDGNQQLPDLRNATRHHFIATTVELLTTGVDVPCVRNIVFFKYVRSPISLTQMIGRGTRIHEETGKLMFTIHDYTNATSLLGESLETRWSTSREDPAEPAPLIFGVDPVEVEGFEVHITSTGNYVMEEQDGKPVRVSEAEYQQRLAEKLVQEVKTLEDLRRRWVATKERGSLLERLRQNGCSPEALRVLQEMQDYDLYDILAELGFGMAPCTRADRAAAFDYKHKEWLDQLPRRPAAVIKAFVRQFERNGIDELENPQIFKVPSVREAGGQEALREAGDAPGELVREAKERIFTA